MDLIARCEQVESDIDNDINRLLNVLLFRKQMLLTEVRNVKDEYLLNIKKLQNQKTQLQENLPKDDIPYDNEVAMVMSKIKSDIEEKISQVEDRRKELDRVEISLSLDKHSIECELQDVGRISYKPVFSPYSLSVTPLKLKPCILSVDESRNVYAITNGYIGLVIDSNGKIILKSDISKPSSDASQRKYGCMAISATQVFVSLTVEHSVDIYDKQWSHISNLGMFGSEKCQFDLPQGLCVSNEQLFVCDCNNNRVQTFKNTEFTGFIGTDNCTSGKLFHPVDIRLFKNTEIYVLTRDNPCVSVFSSSHDLLRKFGSLAGGELGGVMSRLCITESSHVIIIPRSTASVYVYERKGCRCVKVESSEKFSQLTSICLYKEDEFIGCDYRNSSLVIFNSQTLLEYFN